MNFSDVHVREIECKNGKKQIFVLVANHILYFADTIDIEHCQVVIEKLIGGRK